MLLKIDVIEQIGRFASLKHKAPQFQKLTLVYARNGYGKSTLCTIFRSVAEQDAKLISSRRKLGAKAESKVQMQWEAAGLLTFSAGNWNGNPGRLYIFDNEYIQQNIYVSGSVTRDNKRRLISVVLGDYGVQLAKLISSLDAEQRENANALAVLEKLIKTAFPIVSDIKTFVETSAPDDIDAQLDKALREIELAVEHLSDEACPFCSQDITSVEIVSLFRAYFGEAYAELISQVEKQVAALLSLYGDDGVPLTTLIDNNNADYEFWLGVCDLGSDPMINAEDKLAVLTGVSKLKALLEKKKEKPFTGLSFDDDRLDLDRANEILRRYSDAAAKANMAIDRARDRSLTVDFQKAADRLARLQALKALGGGLLKDEIASWRETSTRRGAIEIEKKAAQAKLRSHMDTTISSRQKEINTLLEMFGASFRLVETKASFVGREASTDFSIAIGPFSIKAGEASATEPSFATVLSGGDKFTLALALFISQVRADAALSDAKIVFDDPFSSQDMQRQWETTSQIRLLSESACQVIVLSHDPRFLALIEKNSSAFGSFQLMCDDTGLGAVSLWSSSDELKELYVRQAERIREYATKGKLLQNVTVEALIKDLRPFLEDFIKARFPGRFGPLIMLDDMANQIQAAGPDDPFYLHVSAFRAINQYSRDNMHGGGKAPDPEQLRSQCKRICAVVGAY